jgi:hypothetical protein
MPGAGNDYEDINEIIPDGIFVPGTQVEYYYRSYWYNGGAPPTSYYTLQLTSGYFEVTFLPTMKVRQGQDYQVEWPSVLFVDAFNRGTEAYMVPVFEQIGVAVDKYDYEDYSSNYKAALKRSLRAAGHNPGGYGNNGCTPEQLLGYRCILFNTGYFDTGGEAGDFDLFDQWLSTTDCGLANIRRAFILDGDGVATLAEGYDPEGIQFLHNVLGARVVDYAYRDYNTDPAYCVFLEPVAQPKFSPAAPGVALWGNGCPDEWDYNVLGVQPGVDGAMGNLMYWSYGLTGAQEYVNFAEIVREYDVTGVGDYRTVVNGFSLNHLSERYCPAGEDCSNDSTCISKGVRELYGPMFDYLGQGAPFVKWLYPCTDTGVEEDPVANLGPVNYLHQSRPNPFNTRATIRFSMASQGDVNLSVFDVSGRLVTTLMDGLAEQGENSLVWDGTDSNGNQVGGGIFWMQMSTHDGYTSGKKMLLLR